MNSESIAYQLSYHKLEQELEALSYDIHMCDEQLSVYSTHIADMILRACMDIEAISKILCMSQQDSKHVEGHRFDSDYISSLKLQDESTLLIMAGQTIEKNELAICFPFRKNEERRRVANGPEQSNKQDYCWNNAYQNIKHNKTCALEKYGNLRNLFYTLSALFILNYHLNSQDDIPSRIFCKLGTDGTYCKPIAQSGRFQSLSGENKEYYDKMIGGSK